MGEITRIEEQLRRAFEGGAWHGPAVREVLEGVTAAQAAARPIAAAHSIWELVLHIAAWEDAVRRRLEGERVALSDAEDWPAEKATSAAAWRRAREKLSRGHRALRAAVASFPEARLDKVASGQSTSAYVLIHGAIQHDLYHAGQIAVLKKGAQNRRRAAGRR